NTAESPLDLSKWDVLAVDVENVSAEKQSRLLMSVTSGGPEKTDIREVNVGIALNPGEKRTMRLKLPHRWKYAHPASVPGVRTLDTARITRIEFLVQWPYERPTQDLVNWKISNLRGEAPLT